MSLAQLGKGHVTAPAIYLIETGRTRPSLPTLEHIARRTGKPVEFFLAEPAGASDETQASLLVLEAKVAGGRYQEAISLGKWLLDQGASAFRLGRIRFFLAQAYLGAAEPDHADALLAEARAHFEAINDRLMLAECIGAQAILANIRQSKDGVALAREALEACRSMKPVPRPTEARLLSVLGAAFLANREMDEAAAAFEQAIALAGPLLDLRRMADTYAALGTSYQEAGESETAARYTMRAVALLDVLRDRVAAARAENDLALVLMGRGDFAAAHGHLERAFELSEESNVEFGRTNVLLTQSELAVQEGELEHAQERARQALDLAERLHVGPSIAEAHVWLGRIADRRADHQTADAEFEQAIKTFESLGMRERLLHTHGVYAEVLERRGELAKAYVHMKQALQASRPGLLRRDPQEQKVNSA